MSFNIDIFTLIGLGFSSIGLFLAMFFLLNSKLKDDGYAWLYVIMILIALELGYKTFIHSRIIIEYSFLFVPGRYTNVLLYPSFLLFIWSFTKPHTGKWKWVLILPVVVYVLVVFGRWLTMEVAYKEQLLVSFYQDSRPGPYNYWQNPGTLFKTIIFPLFFLIPIAYEVRTFGEKFSDKADRRLLSTLVMVIWGYFVFTLAANPLYKFLYQLTEASFIEWPVDIFFLSGIICLFSMISLWVHMGSSLFPKSKYSGSALTEERYEAIFSKVIHLIEAEKLYLQKSLTAKELAGHLGINSKYVSQVVNHQTGKSLTEFINGYRVEEAKTQLLDTNNHHLTLEAIGNLAGFHSKSSFYSAFKKLTGETPATFARRMEK